jgi:hypothetical protein
VVGTTPRRAFLEGSREGSNLKAGSFKGDLSSGVGVMEIEGVGAMAVEGAEVTVVEDEEQEEEVHLMPQIAVVITSYRVVWQWPLQCLLYKDYQAQGV